MRVLHVRRPGAAREHGHAYLRDDLIGLEGGREHVHEELPRWDRPSPPGARRHDLRVEREDRRRIVRGGIGVGHAPADGAPVPHLHVADHGGNLGQQRALRLEHGAVLDGVVGRQRADRDLLAVGLDPVQPADPADVDDDLRLRQPELHDRKEAVPPGQELRIVPVLLEQTDRLADGLRREVLERRGNQGPLTSPISSCRGSRSRSAPV